MAFTESAAVDLAGHPLGNAARSEVPPGASSAVSWGAILAGAAAAAALSLILLLLGLGLGLSSISPWSQRGIDAAAFGISTIVWITVTQLLSSGMGGYLAGRLRSKWVAVHADEAYFRDTAHGFLAWAVASLATAALIGSILASVISGGVQAGATVAGGAATAAAGGVAAMATGDKAGKGADSSGPMSYFIDSLFRANVGPRAAASTTADAATGTPPAAGAATDASEATAAGMASNTASSASPAAASSESNAAHAAEVSRIFVNSLATGTLPADDLRYVGQLVAQRTGLDPAAAEQRVSQTYARMQAKLQEASAAAKEAADKARKATVYATLWLFVSLLAGAFAASLAATVGGRQRDL